MAEERAPKTFMTERERQEQEYRVKKFDQLCTAEKELDEAIDTLDSQTKEGKSSVFTANSSQVRHLERIVIDIKGGTNPTILPFPTAVIPGYEIADALKSIFTKRREMIWKAKQDL